MRLEGKGFRKWRVGGFPVSVFFRIENEDVIVLEALYAHRMDIAARFTDDIE
jgi:mRNA-degrading endonuclease RelE of RelBE toxin-antitoxin system